jgi:hypothetical protein
MGVSVAVTADVTLKARVEQCELAANSANMLTGNDDAMLDASVPLHTEAGHADGRPPEAGPGPPVATPHRAHGNLFDDKGKVRACNLSSDFAAVLQGGTGFFSHDGCAAAFKKAMECAASDDERDKLKKVMEDLIKDTTFIDGGGCMLCACCARVSHISFA